MSLLKRLLGISGSGNKRPSQPAAVSPPLAPAPTSRDVVDRYYATMAQVQGAMSRRDYDAAARAVRENLKLIPAWVNATRREYGSFDISSIPGIEQGGIALALMGDDEGLAEMRRIAAQTPELEPWSDRVEQSGKDRQLFRTIMEAVEASPGCLQTDVKALVGEADGSRVALLIGYLEKAGKFARVKAGKTYRLVLPGAADFPTPPPKRGVASHRKDRKPPPLHEIDIAKLDYVPLPRSPSKWEEAQADAERRKVTDAVEPFELRDARWRIASIDKIKPAERPDTAFRISQLGAAGLFLIDDLGKAEGLGPIEASALRYDHAGVVSNKVALLRDVYRYAVHPTGHGMIALSREAILHAYDDELRPIFETTLAAAPEIAAIRKRFEISDDELKNHVRCIALSCDTSRYLFTVVDEAWCVGLDGIGLWGAKLPVKDGWTQVATPSSGFGTSEEVGRALALMDLKLPITPDELKSRYRALAKKWHPDLNPGDPKSGEKMAALSTAAEILTGIDASTLPEYAGARFAQELHRGTIEAGGRTLTLTMSLQVSEKFASDWIYAASFAAASNSVYLAGYSGRIVLVDENGVGVRVYDIGAVPRQIVDTGKYLYLLTYTRLYVIKDNALHALIDTFEGGELLVAEDGFGLLEKKRLRWFKPDGGYAGSVVTRDPIRRAYFCNSSLIMETRQMRARFEGVLD